MKCHHQTIPLTTLIIRSWVLITLDVSPNIEFHDVGSIIVFLFPKLFDQISRWPVGIEYFFTIGLGSEHSRTHYCFIIGKQMKTTHYTWFGSSTILQDYQENLSTSCNQMQEQDIHILIFYLLRPWFIIWKKHILQITIICKNENDAPVLRGKLSSQ